MTRIDLKALREDPNRKPMPNLLKYSSQLDKIKQRRPTEKHKASAAFLATLKEDPVQ